MFLPPPRIPRHTDHLPPSTLLRDIHPDTADAVDMIEDLHTRVWRLVSVLEDSRPDGSGQVWRAALDADAQTVLDGKPPKRWETQALIESDPARWAEASAQARTFTRRRDTILSTVDWDGLTVAINDHFLPRVEPLPTVLRDGYQSIGAQKSVLFGKWEEAQRLVGLELRRRRLLAWAAGRGRVEFIPPQQKMRDFDADTLPELLDPVSRGYWYRVRQEVEPGRRMSTIPQGVRWPDDNLPEHAVGKVYADVLRDGVASVGG